MKKILVALTAFFAFAVAASAASSAPAKVQESFGKAQILLGAGFGGGGLYTSTTVGGLVGLQYYLPASQQFGAFRQGSRAILAYSYGIGEESASFIRASWDYTVDFTPGDKLVWGAFTGISMDKGFSRKVCNFYYCYTLSSPYDFAWSIGASLELFESHRIEAGLSLLGGYYDFFTLRYIYKF